MRQHYHMGIDYFTPSAGVREEIHCKACGEPLSVKRNVKRTRGKYGFEIKPPRMIDVFSCENTDQRWHRQVIDLKKYLSRIPSRKISDIIEQEIEEILENREPTKTPTLDDNWD